MSESQFYQDRLAFLHRSGLRANHTHPSAVEVLTYIAVVVQVSMINHVECMYGGLALLL